MRNSLRSLVPTESMPTQRLLMLCYNSETDGAHRSSYTSEIGVIRLPFGLVLVELQTNLNLSLPTLMVELSSLESFDQLMCWMETTKTEYPDFSTTLTPWCATPQTKQPNTLTRLSSRLVVGGFRMMEFFRNLWSVM